MPRRLEHVTLGQWRVDGFEPREGGANKVQIPGRFDLPPLRLLTSRLTFVLDVQESASIAIFAHALLEEAAWLRTEVAMLLLLLKRVRVTSVPIHVPVRARKAAARAYAAAATSVHEPH